MAKRKKKKRKERLKWPTKDISYYENLFANSNVHAFLQTIRDAEGTEKELGYHTLVGGGIFEDLSTHPNTLNGKFDSRAAGAYQFIYDTWHIIETNLKLKDFGVHNQDIAAVYYLDYLTALDEIVNGNIESAVGKASGTWVSLNGKKDKINKHIQPLDAVLKLYQKHGGVLHGAGHSLVPPTLSKKPSTDTVNYRFPKFIVADNLHIPRPIIRDKLPDEPDKYPIPDLTKTDSLSGLPKWISNGFGKNNSKPLGRYAPGKKNIDNKQKISPPNSKFHFPLIKPETNGLKTREKTDFLFEFTKPNPLSEAGKNSSAIFPIPAYHVTPIADFSNSEAGSPLPFGSFTDEISAQGSATNTGIRDSDRSVTVNLNTPMIGSFSVNTSEGAGLGDLRQQVEEVLFEVINSVNTV